MPRAEVCDGLDNDCDERTDPSGPCPDGCSGGTHADHTYLFCGVASSALTALSRCQDHGMLPVVISSQAENAFVHSNASGTTWIGASDAGSEGTWLWADGTQFWSGDEGGAPVQGRFNAWLSGQPNDAGQGQGQAREDCAILLGSSAGWNDVSCNSAGFRASCESAD